MFRKFLAVLLSTALLFAGAILISSPASAITVHCKDREAAVSRGAAGRESAHMRDISVITTVWFKKCWGVRPGHQKIWMPQPTMVAFGWETANGQPWNCKNTAGENINGALRRIIVDFSMFDWGGKTINPREMVQSCNGGGPRQISRQEINHEGRHLRYYHRARDGERWPEFVAFVRVDWKGPLYGNETFTNGGILHPLGYSGIGRVDRLR